MFFYIIGVGTPSLSLSRNTILLIPTSGASLPVHNYIEPTPFIISMIKVLSPESVIRLSLIMGL